ncbi:MAG: sigma-E factor negative regulatory protein [Rubrivivax sp.]|jgi:sigma-E factor negative regulatory protein RseA|nr:sigma-E factor negative regulatory protein [Rubrivivax sp.]
MTAPLPEPADAARMHLSSLMDGEAGADVLERACDDWRRDPALRRDWHAFHLIGDVMRSQDLASEPRRDEVFLARLRERLQAEPVVLAPAALPAASPARRWQGWLTPAAVAAGFVAVAGVLVVTRAPAPADAGGPGPLAAAPGASRASTDLRQASLSPGSQNLDGRMIRDAQLDAYLRAHRQGVAVAPTAMPGGALRSVETIAPER